MNELVASAEALMSEIRRRIVLLADLESTLEAIDGGEPISIGGSAVYCPEALRRDLRSQVATDRERTAAWLRSVTKSAGFEGGDK